MKTPALMGRGGSRRPVTGAPTFARTLSKTGAAQTPLLLVTTKALIAALAVK